MPLPTPPGWPPVPIRRRQVVFGLVVGTLSVVAGVLYVLADGRPWAPFGFGLFWYGLAYLSLRSRQPDVISRDGALVVRSSRPRVAVVAGSAAAVGLGFTLQAGWPLGAGVAALFVLVFALWARRGLGGEVALDPEAVTFRVPSFHRRVPWADSGRVGMNRDGRLVVEAQGTRLWVRTEAFDGDPLVLYWTLRYYATNPESRPELADDRAVQRVLREDLA